MTVTDRALALGAIRDSGGCAKSCAHIIAEAIGRLDDRDMVDLLTSAFSEAREAGYVEARQESGDEW